LRNNEINDIEDFFKTPKEKLSKILGISKSRIQKLKEKNVYLLEKEDENEEKPS
jgi:hypothetical protein